MAELNVYESPYPMPSVPVHQSVSQFLLSSDPDDTHPETVILADFDAPDARKITYAGLRKIASRDAAVLQQRYDLQEGDVMCIYGYNSVNWACLAHAALWAGACFCGVNPLATKFELEHYFKIATPTAIAVDAGLLENVEHAIRVLKMRPTIIVIDDDRAGTDPSQTVYPRDFIKHTERAEPLDLAKRDNRVQHAAMCFSSGTSGAPKAVVMSHHSLIAQILALRSTNPFLHSNKIREVFFPSFAHVYGLVSAILMPAWVGSYCQIMKRFDYMQYLQRCEEIRATVLRLVPAAAVRMIKDKEVRKLDLRTVQAVMCSGAALSDETVNELQSLLAPGAGVLNGYGMTEATVTLLRETRRDKGASVGRPSAGVSIRVVDDCLKDVTPGSDGECLIRGPTIFLEYKNNPTATKEAKTCDGWLRTGDIVRADLDGFFYLTGRKKELIKFRGNQIAPAELEAILLLDKRITDAGVCGIYDKTLDTEIPIGFVVLSSGATKDPDTQRKILMEVRSFANGRVAPYKKFREELIPIDALPKNASGKLLRRELTARATELRSRKHKL